MLTSMNYAALRFISVVIATIGASVMSPNAPRTVHVSPGCLVLGTSDSVEILRDAKELTTSSANASDRSNLSIPYVVPDSVSYYADPISCDTVANRYRLMRTAHGDSDQLAPVFMVRLGNSGKFFATARVGKGRDYLLLDSLLGPVSRIDLY